MRSDSHRTTADGSHRTQQTYRCQSSRLHAFTPVSTLNQLRQNLSHEQEILVAVNGKGSPRAARQNSILEVLISLTIKRYVVVASLYVRLFTQYPVISQLFVKWILLRESQDH